MSDFPVQTSAGMTAEDVDIGAPTVSPSQLCLMRSAGVDGTLAGHFVDIKGFPIVMGGVVSYTGTFTTPPGTLLSILGLGALPVDDTTHRVAVGFKGQVNGADALYCYASVNGVSVPATVSADMVAHAARYPVLFQTQDLHSGRG